MTIIFKQYSNPSTEMIKIMCCVAFATVLEAVNPSPKPYHLQEGPSDFAELVKAPYFVDKTMLIKEVLSEDLVRVTTPRGFGKTVNLDMIRRFCDMPIDAEGYAWPLNDTDDYRLFTENDLEIYGSEHREFFDEHFAQYPVIHLAMKEASAHNFTAFWTWLKVRIAREFDKHRYLRNSTYVDVKTRRLFDEYYTLITGRNRNTFHALHCLTALSNLLFEHFERKVVILIDDYDSPVHRGILESLPHVGEILDYLADLIACVVNANRYIKSALVLGSFKMIPVKRRVTANVIVTAPFLCDREFTKYFGLTGADVDYLLAVYNRTHMKENVSRWYGGYMTQYDGDAQWMLYRTSAVVRYLEFGEAKSYWCYVSCTRYLRKLCRRTELRRKLQQIVKLKRRRVRYEVCYNNDDVRRLRRYALDEFGDEYLDADQVFRYMIDLGYFYFDWDRQVLRLPNEEFGFELAAKVFGPDLLRTVFDFDQADRERFRDSMAALDGSTESFERMRGCLVAFFAEWRVQPTNLDEFQFAVANTVHGLDLQAVRSGLDLAAGRGRPSTKVPLLAIDNGTAFVVAFDHFEVEGSAVCSGERALRRIVDEGYARALDDPQFAAMNVTREIYVGLHFIKRNQVGKVAMCYLYNSRRFDDRICIGTKKGVSGAEAKVIKTHRGKKQNERSRDRVFEY